jgi:hypothetical protein
LTVPRVRWRAVPSARLRRSTSVRGRDDPLPIKGRLVLGGEEARCAPLLAEKSLTTGDLVNRRSPCDERKEHLVDHLGDLLIRWIVSVEQ